MSDMTLVPTGGFGGEAGAAALGGGIGGLIGSWFGNGWGGGGGWGGRGNFGGPVEVQASVDTNAILQAINNGALQTIEKPFADPLIPRVRIFEKFFRNTTHRREEFSNVFRSKSNIQLCNIFIRFHSYHPSFI